MEVKSKAWERDSKSRRDQERNQQDLSASWIIWVDQLRVVSARRPTELDISPPIQTRITVSCSFALRHRLPPKQYLMRCFGGARNKSAA